MLGLAYQNRSNQSCPHTIKGGYIFPFSLLLLTGKIYLWYKGIKTPQWSGPHRKHLESMVVVMGIKSMKAVYEIMVGQGLKRSALARRIGIAPTTLKERFKQQNASVALLVETVRPMDYKVVLMPSSERLKDGWYEIE